MRSSKDISEYKVVGNAATKSKHAVVEVEDKAGKRYHAKPEKNSEVAQSEIGAQQLIGAFLSSTPRTFCATDKNDYETTYVLSESVEGFVSLNQLFNDKNIGVQGVIDRIKNGTYKGFGHVIVMAILTNEADLHGGNIGIDKNGQFVKIDGDWANGRVRYGEDIEGFKFNITEALIAALPKLSTNSYLPYNYFEQVTGGLINLKTDFLDQVAMLSRVQLEINQQLLKCMLMPPEYISRIMSSVQLDINDNSVADLYYSEHIKARLQLIQGACMNETFASYLTTDDAMATVLEFSEELSKYQLVDGSILANPDVINDKIEARMISINELTHARSNQDTWDDVYTELVAQDTGARSKSVDYVLVAAIESGDLNLVQSICANDQSIVNRVGVSGLTPLMTAINCGDMGIYQYLKSLPLDYLVVGKGGYTALHYAAKNGDVSIVQDMLDAGFSVDTTNASGKSALIIAAREGRHEAVSFLLAKGANPLLKGADKATALHYAVMHGKTDVVTILLMEPTVINKTTDRQIQAAFIAAIFESEFKTAKQLLDAFGMDGIIYNQDCVNHLAVYAAHYCDDDLFNQLLLHKPDLTIFLKNSSSAVNEAAANQSYGILNNLLKQPIMPVNVLDTSGRGVIDHLVANGKMDIAVNVAIQYKMVNEVVNQKEGTQLIHLAALSGDVGAIDTLIKNSATLDKDNDGNTPFMIAISKGDLPCVELFIKSGKISKQEQQDALVEAIYGGHLDVVKFLVDDCKLDINAATSASTQYTPVIAAARNGQIDILNYILQHPTFNSINKQGFGGITALDKAIQYGFHEAAYFLINNPMMDLRKEEFTPDECMQFLLQGNAADLDTIKKLLAEGADVNFALTTSGYPGYTPLMYAVKEAELDAVNYLLSLPNVDMNYQAKDGATAFSLATELQHWPIAKILAFQDKAPVMLTDMSLESGLENMAKDNLDLCADVLIHRGRPDYILSPDTNLTLLHGACEYGDRDVVKKLIEAGADVNAKTSSNETPLFFAVLNGHQAVFDMLMNAGVQASINVVNDEDESPLLLAVSGNHLDMIDKLLATGVIDNKTPDSDGMQAFLTAMFVKSDFAQCDIFLKHGFSINAIANPMTGDNLLHQAVNLGLRNAIDYLSKNGANFDARNADGKTAAQLAIGVGDNALASKLNDYRKKAQDESIRAKRASAGKLPGVMPEVVPDVPKRFENK